MPVNSRGQRTNTHHKNKDKQKAQANELRKKKPKYSTGGPGVGGASMGGGS